MWMKIALLLAALLIWDAVTSKDGQSTVAHGGEMVLRIGPVHDFVDYVERGDALRDTKSIISSAAASISASLSDAAAAQGLTLPRKKTADANQQSTAQPIADQPATDQSTRDAIANLNKANDTLTAAAAALEKERQERIATREKRRAELHLSPEDVAKIAAAVNDLYVQEKKEAAAASPDSATALFAPPPAPTPEAVEKSAAALGPDLLSAIVKASDETGANSGYLLHIALRESGLVLGAAAPTSSAVGPFQFIQQTWFQMIGTYGAKHKLDAEVALLTKQSNGQYKPISDAARDELLALRTDPYVSALMAGELTMENSATLTKLLGRPPAHGELYAAHVLGSASAVKLVQTREKASSTSAAKILPSAAAANRWLFYASNGEARSVSALFDELSRFMTTSEVATVCNANLHFFGS